MIKKNLHILYLDPEARKVFTPEPFITFRTSRSLKKLLVKAKVPPLAREKGCKKCNKARCLTCQNIQETDTFECTVDGEQYRVYQKKVDKSEIALYFVKRFNVRTCLLK